jgi:Lrp/AsnC family transcriptional regulator, leucine-responsive regulatory protein
MYPERAWARLLRSGHRQIRNVKDSSMSASKKSTRVRSKALRPRIKLDDIDLLILSMLQGHARVPNAEIARRAKMVPSGILERLRKLTKSNVILGYETRLDPRVLGLGLLAFVSVAADDRIGNTDTAGLLAKIPEVQEVHNVAGEDCYLLKIRAADPQELGEILRNKVKAIKSVKATKTTIVLDTAKETSVFPLQSSRETHS